MVHAVHSVSCSGRWAGRWRLRRWQTAVEPERVQASTEALSERTQWIQAAMGGASTAICTPRPSLCPFLPQRPLHLRHLYECRCYIVGLQGKALLLEQAVSTENGMGQAASRGRQARQAAEGNDIEALLQVRARWVLAATIEPLPKLCRSVLPRFRAVCARAADH